VNHILETEANNKRLLMYANVKQQYRSHFR